MIFADEPTGALNSKAAEDVMKEICSANQMGTSVLMVTHSVKVAARSNRVIYLVDGNIRGELSLEQYNDGDDLNLRERRLNTWLMDQGW